eukprot:475742_1
MNININILLTLIAKIEYKYIETYRNHYPIFNIHPPRSAGTFICEWFKSCQQMQQKSAQFNTTLHERPIRPYSIPKSNCNAGEGSQFPSNYITKPASKTCKKQYKKLTMNNYFTMIAREAPLHNNKNAYIAHALLCDKFVYILVIRSPIERILSWLSQSTVLETYDMNTSQWIHFNKKSAKEISSILPGFYASLFNNKISKISDGYIVNYNNNSDGNGISIRINRRGMWLKPYSSNAITKWIGYEWQNVSVIDGNHEQGLFVSSDEFKELYFYNAINLLLQIDYVLNFASFNNDISAVKAIQTDELNINHNMFENIINCTEKTQINESMIWNVFAKHMNRHFNVQNIFTVGDSVSVNSRKSTQRFADSMTENDWRALYKANYFDFRLYSFAKYIARIDLRYYTHYLSMFT